MSAGAARAAEAAADEDAAPRAGERLSFLIHRVNARIAATANRLFRTYGIESFGARILVLLLERDDQRAGALVEALSLPQPTLSHQLARLERRGLIRRRRTEADNRSVAVALTPRGREVARECEALSAGVHRHMVQDLAPGEVEALKRMLVSMADTLARYEREPPPADAAPVRAVSESRSPSRRRP